MVEKVPAKKNIKIIKIPLTKLATELGNVKTANMIAIGVFAGMKEAFKAANTWVDGMGRVKKNSKEIAQFNTVMAHSLREIAQEEKKERLEQKVPRIPGPNIRA